MSGPSSPMPFDFGELFTASVREIVPRLQARKLAFVFDCRGQQLTLSGDPVEMRCSLHRLLCGLVELIEVGFLVFDAEAVCRPGGRPSARVRLAGTGLPADAGKVAAVLRHLDLSEAQDMTPDAGGRRRAAGRCPRTDAPIEFLSLGKDGLILRADWVDGQAECWEPARPVDALGAPAWVINENALGARALARRLQRLGWTPRTFARAQEARQALLALHGQAPPALVVALESPSLAPAELERLARLLPAETQCIHAVAVGSPVLAGAARPDGFDVRVFPLSPWELHQLTERLRELRRAPGRQTFPRPMVQEERPRLLVVDDNPLTRLLARSLAEGLGYEAASVADGVAALYSCEQWSPDVVLMDVHMQPWSGIETTRRLRELQGKGAIAPCAVVAVTADASEATRRACLEAGMDGHLGKPLLLATMAAELNRVCAGHGRRTDMTGPSAMAGTALRPSMPEGPGDADEEQIGPPAGGPHAGSG